MNTLGEPSHYSLDHFIGKSFSLPLNEKSSPSNTKIRTVLVRPMARWTPMILALAVFFVIGMAAAFWTERLRRYWIRQSERHPNALHWRLVARRVRAPWYSIELRLIGILCLATVIFFVWGFLRS